MSIIVAQVVAQHPQVLVVVEQEVIPAERRVGHQHLVQWLMAETVELPAVVAVEAVAGQTQAEREETEQQER